jgi:8-oxo-dGTP pyrophosphatase MutT (NUDIX family)
VTGGGAGQRTAPGGTHFEPYARRFPGFTVQTTGRLLALAEFRPEGAPFPYELVARPPGVRVIGLTSDRSGIWLTDEWRQAEGGRDVRLPGGKLSESLEAYLDDVATGREPSEEEVLEAARLEFSQEVGLNLLDPHVVGMAPCGATVLWDLYYVAGTAADGEPEQALERGEDVRPLLVSVEEALQRAKTTMGEARSALQLMRFCEALLHERASGRPR